jgi:hypothetical protein
MMMFKQDCLRTLWLLLAIPLAAVLHQAAYAGDVEREEGVGALEFSETVVAGGPDDFMEVRHIVLRGSNFAIGKKLAELAYARHKAGPLPYPDHRANGAQIRYFEVKYPVFVERMRGVAAAMGKDLRDSTWNFSTLLYGIPLSGCSVVFYPAATTADSLAVLSRNFDFTTGTFTGEKPGENRLPACARTYVIEMYPDEGYPSLSTCTFDLLSGVMDGVNSEGLAVAILSDNDVIAEGGTKPFSGFRLGFNESQILRYLLDTCANAEEARIALRTASLYYNTAPYHYIIADSAGDVFIWENSPDMDRGYAIDGDGGPLVTTNFLLHRHPDLDSLPADEHHLGWFNRFREIRRRIAEHDGKFDDRFVKETNACVSMVYTPNPEEPVPVRTLWHALYYPEIGRAQLDFYLGESADPDSPRGLAINHSGYVTFLLKP